MKVYDNPYDLWEVTPVIIRDMFKNRVLTKLALSRLTNMDFYIVETEFKHVYLVVVREEYGKLITIYYTSKNFYTTVLNIYNNVIPEGEYILWNRSLN